MNEHPFILSVPVMAASMNEQAKIDFAIAAVKACDMQSRAEIIAGVAPTVPDDVALHASGEKAQAEAFFLLATQTTIKIYAAAAWARMETETREAFVAWLMKQVGIGRKAE